MSIPSAKEIRLTTGLSQAEFSLRYGFNVHTLRQWEQGRTSPDGAARVLLMVIAAAPKAVEDAVAASRPQRISASAA